MITRSRWLLACALITQSGMPRPEPERACRPIVTAPQEPAAVIEVRAASPTALHRAWMLEILDLDSAGAARLYAEVVADRRPRNLARWVAAARLAELQRLDVAGGSRVDVSEAPTPLQPRFTEADTTLNIEPLLQRIAAEPEDVLLDIATEAGALPNLRPIVTSAEFWFIEQVGESRRDRRARFLATQHERPPLTKWVYAYRILRDELDGKRKQAEEKRSNFFILWQPPSSAAEPEVELARFRGNIETLLAEREWGWYRRRHRQLKETVEGMAADDPAAAMALVRRLPLYAERLLAPIPEEDR